MFLFGGDIFQIGNSINILLTKITYKELNNRKERRNKRVLKN